MTIVFLAVPCLQSIKGYCLNKKGKYLTKDFEILESSEMPECLHQCSKVNAKACEWSEQHCYAHKKEALAGSNHEGVYCWIMDGCEGHQMSRCE